MRFLIRSALGAAAFTAINFAPLDARTAEITSDSGTENNAILIIGEIKPGDDQKFRKIAANFEDAIVFLESEGGSTTTAIEIGEAVRLKGFSTVVINGSACNSACALIWLAGTPRALSRSARIGFHATYTNNDGRSSESGVGNALVGRYFTLLNLPARAVIFATLAPPTSLSWLTSQNLSEAGISAEIVDDVALENEDEEVPPPPITFSRANQTTVFSRPGNWQVLVDHTMGDACFIISSFEDKTIFRVGLSPATRNNYVVIGNPNWASLEVNDKHRVEFKFDRETPWDVPLTVRLMGSDKALMATFSDNAFWAELIAANSLQITRAGKSVVSLSMEGTAAAFDDLIKCQKVANRSKSARDPFAD